MNSDSVNDTSLITFKSISNFTQELGELFSKRQRPLKLYCRLIEKTTLSHNKSIEKHIDAFRRFCKVNRNAIIKKDFNKFTQTKISYSQRVFIDLEPIFRHSDKETTQVIWQHILCISALVDPNGNAKEILKNERQNVAGGDNETNFLNNIFQQVENSGDPNSSNPMEMISSIMQSGIITDVMQSLQGGMQDGQLDIGKLMGSMQQIMTKMSGNSGPNPEADKMMNMVTTMMTSMTQGMQNMPTEGKENNTSLETIPENKELGQVEVSEQEKVTKQG